KAQAREMPRPLVIQPLLARAEHPDVPAQIEDREGIAVLQDGRALTGPRGGGQDVELILNLDDVFHLVRRRGDLEGRQVGAARRPSPGPSRGRTAPATRSETAGRGRATADRSCAPDPPGRHTRSPRRAPARRDCPNSPGTPAGSRRRGAAARRPAEPPQWPNAP